MADKKMLGLGQVLRDARISKGWSQEDLASRAGVSRNHVAGVERGGNVSVDLLGRIASHLGVNELPLGDAKLLALPSDTRMLRETLSRIHEDSARLLLTLGALGSAVETAEPKSPKSKATPKLRIAALPFEVWPEEGIDVSLTAVAAAGAGTDETVTDETVRVPREMVPSKSQFLLRARGDSMADFGIEDGDILLVERRKGGVAASGEIVVAWISTKSHEGLVVKRWHRRRGEKKLLSENPDFPSIDLNDGDYFELQGIVRKFMRKPTKPVIRELSKLSG